MRAVIRRLLVFGWVAVLLHVGSLLLLPRILPTLKWYHHKLGGYGHMHSRLRDVQNYRNVDILFLGSSHTYTGFDVRLFEGAGYSCFNLGSTAQTPVQTEYLLERHLAKLNPSLVVYEVCAVDLQFDGYESTIDLIANDKINADLVIMALQQRDLIIFNSLLYSTGRQLLRMDGTFKEERRHGSTVYVRGGFVESTRSEIDTSDGQRKATGIRSDNKEAFYRIISLFRARGIRFVLVASPRMLYGRQWFELNAQMEAIVQGVAPYYCATDSLDLDARRDFTDHDHLTATGVKKYNRWLLEKLTRDGLLTRRSS